jgi:hypothetical protein
MVAHHRGTTVIRASLPGRVFDLRTSVGYHIRFPTSLFRERFQGATLVQDHHHRQCPGILG